MSVVTRAKEAEVESAGSLGEYPPEGKRGLEEKEKKLIIFWDDLDL